MNRPQTLPLALASHPPELTQSSAQRDTSQLSGEAQPEFTSVLLTKRKKKLTIFCHSSAAQLILRERESHLGKVGASIKMTGAVFTRQSFFWVKTASALSGHERVLESTYRLGSLFF